MIDKLRVCFVRRSVPSALPLALITLMAVSIVGCENETAKDESAPTLDQRMKKLGACMPSDLVTLTPWTGPAFGDDGKLLAPLPAGHVEAVVNGWRKLDQTAIELRNQYGQLVAQDVFTRPGLLGFEAFESDECDISMSHTLWKDEASMMAFVTGPAHGTAMANAPKMHHAFGGAHWMGEARTVAPTWHEGIVRLVQVYH